MEKSAAIYPLEQKSNRATSNIMITLTGWRGRPAAIVFLLLIALAFGIFGPNFWRPVRHFVFDSYQRIFPREVNRFPVVIVDIDDASLAALGRWPWPRTRISKLTEAAYRLGARAIGFDIIMPERDTLSPDIILAHRPEVSPLAKKELAKLPSNDAILAQTLKRTPSVVARAALIDVEKSGDAKSRQTPVRTVGELSTKDITSYNGHLANIPEIEQAAFGCGYLNDTRDQDGVVRSMPLLLAVNDGLAPSLSVELLRTSIGANWYSAHGTADGVQGIQIGESFIPTDPDGRIRLHFSPAYAQRRISALSVLNDKLAADSFANQVAIIGVTGVGTSDIATTPVTARMDGVEIQAQVVENILSNSRLIRPQNAVWVELSVFLLIATAFILVLPHSHPGYGIVLILLTIILLCSVSITTFITTKTLYDPSFPIAGNALVLIVLLTAGFAASIHRRRELDLALEAERLERMRISGELQAAREIQMGMLPAPESIDMLPDNIEFYALLEPAEEVGGDLYDAFMVDERHFFFLVGDVVGKGVAASLFMALSKTLCKSMTLRGHTQLDELMVKINEEISRENQAMLFVTAIAGIIDVFNGELQVGSAGHDIPILIRPDEAPKRIDIDGGPPLCVIEDYKYNTTRVVMHPDDVLVLVSDGVAEAQNPDQVLYGRDRIMKYLHSIDQIDRNAEGICRGLYEEVRRFSEGAIQSDDITIMVVSYKG